MGTPKEEVEIDLYVGQTMVQYVGRCLGFLSAEEYAALVETPALRRKLMSVDTKSIDDLHSREDTDGMRLAIAFSSKGGVVVSPKQIFVSAPIDFINSFVSGQELALSLQDESFLMINKKSGE
jgi:hypothetical protein